MTLHNRIENLKNRSSLYHYLVSPKEQAEEIITFLEALETIINRAKEAKEMYPHKITLNDYYTEGWQDCLELLGINELIEEDQE